MTFLLQGKPVLVALTAVLLSQVVTWSQGSQAQEAKSVRDVIAAEHAVEEITQEKERSNTAQSGPGATPLITMLGLREAIRKSDFEAAAQYLDLRYLPEELEGYTGEELIKALSLTWRRQVIFDPSVFSDDPRGDLEDGLPRYRDQVGMLELSDGKVPVYLQRIPDELGNRVWKISYVTVSEIPRIWDELGYSPTIISLSEMLPDFEFLGMANWQIIAIVLSLVAAWLAATLISTVLMRIALRIPNRFPLGIERFFRTPMRVFIFVVFTGALVDELGLSRVAQVLLKSSGLDYIGYTVLLLGLLTLVRDYQIRKMELAGNAPFVALLKPATTMLKVILVVVIALFWAESAGYNMSTVIAGLGVGSLAVALAAQKTLENIIGAFTLYTARPVNPGDFCRFGEATGTVEEIGLRSTVIRTLNRTQVIIPNSAFSAGQVENYSVRDRIRFFHNIRLQLSNAEQLRFILAEIRTLFYAHPEVVADSVSVRLKSLEDATALLRLDCGVRTTDFQKFLAVAEDLNLRIIEIVHGAGAVFSGPGQSLQLSEATPENGEEQARVAATLESWRNEDRLPFPDHSRADIAQLSATLDYPPKGSST